MVEPSGCVTVLVSRFAGTAEAETTVIAANASASKFLFIPFFIKN
jgi:hypothetical protein